MVGGVKRGIDDLVPFIRDADLWPEAFAGHLRAGLLRGYASQGEHYHAALKPFPQD